MCEPLCSNLRSASDRVFCSLVLTWLPSQVLEPPSRFIKECHLQDRAEGAAAVEEAWVARSK